MTRYPTFASPSIPAPAGFFMPHGLGRNPAKPLAEAQTGGLYHTALADGGLSNLLVFALSSLPGRPWAGIF